MAAFALMLFAVMFTVVFVARTLVQKRRTGDSGIRAGSLRSALGSAEWFAGWLLVVALVAAAAAPVAELAGLDPWYESVWVRGFGVGFAVVGIVLTFASQLSMGDEWRIGVDRAETTELVTQGAFRVVRNPIFSCVILTGVGLALMVPNSISAIGIVVLVVAIELQVRCVEEPHLRELHGDAYTGYASQVGRLVPGLGRG
ncbi:MAG: isoprenylcysteine carboxylmethyltransferase family protein [Acidimicrobiales bacterium]